MSWWITITIFWIILSFKNFLVLEDDTRKKMTFVGFVLFTAISPIITFITLIEIYLSNK